MKKLLIMCATLLVNISALQAQEFNRGTQTIKLGVGINRWSVPVMVEYELGIVDNLANVDGLCLGVGGYAGFYQYKSGSDYHYSTFYVGTQGLAHYTPVDKLDVYAGAMLGMRFRNEKYLGEHDVNSYFCFTPIVGARFQLTSNFGVYSNLAIDHNMYFISAGIAFKF
jgi:hypothetical protein